MEQHKLSLDQNKLEEHDIDSESQNDSSDVPEALEYNSVNPLHPLKLSFRNEMIAIEVSGWSETNLWNLFNWVLGHPAIKGTNEMLEKFIPQRFALQEKELELKQDKETKTKGTSYT
jgi:hypothetical protein